MLDEIDRLVGEPRRYVLGRIKANTAHTLLATGASDAAGDKRVTVSAGQAPAAVVWMDGGAASVAGKATAAEVAA